ncbi:MAG TPA: hypothetical protein VF432_15820 [Thermoanaerobaculia bacterium]
MNDELFESDYEGEAVFDEQEADYEAEFDQESDVEIELAAELLSLSGEEELDEFFRKLFKRVGGAARGILQTPAGQQLTGLLRNTASQALPLAGQAVGGYIGGTRGSNVGGALGTAAAKWFGLEMEGMSGEDQELEVARRVVRLATDATKQLAAAPRTGDPKQAAMKAFSAAASRHAPGLARRFPGRRRGPYIGGSAYDYGDRRDHGVWIRRGRKVVLYGI